MTDNPEPEYDADLDDGQPDPGDAAIAWNFAASRLGTRARSVRSDREIVKPWPSWTSVTAASAGTSPTSRAQRDTALALLSSAAPRKWRAAAISTANGSIREPPTR